MAELFRYIEQSFVIPSATPAIDVGSESDLQKGLRGLPPDRIREQASEFILKQFSSPVADPFHLGTQYLSFGSQLLSLSAPETRAVEQLVSKVFGSDASTLVGSGPFMSDKALLDDTLVCVKITTAFDRVNATDLVAMRQAIAFIEDFAAGKVTDVTAEGIRTTLRRPIRIPSEFVKSLTVNPDSPQLRPSPDPAADPAAQQRTVLMADQRNLKSAYETIMGLPPDQFELRPVSVKADRITARNAAGRSSAKKVSGGAGSGSFADAVSAAPTFLAVPQAAIERLGGDVRQTLEKANIDFAGAPVSHVITAIKRQWQDVSRRLAPYQVPAPAKVFRIGVHLFAVRDSAPTTAPGTKEAL
jgi:hypothetical protein